MIITISRENLNKCRVFASRCYETNRDCYEKRNQGNRITVMEQIEYGKICEVAVSEMLSIMNARHVGPDFELYEAKNKSYAPDMNIIRKEGFLPVHVKGNSINSKFPASWLFTIGDNVFDTKDVLVFCQYLGGCDVDVIARVTADVAKPLLKEPIMDIHKGNKIALYLEDIVKVAKLY
jgi:hypothetical protein